MQNVEFVSPSEDFVSPIETEHFIIEARMSDFEILKNKKQ